MAMRFSDIKVWAREELLGAVDLHITDLLSRRHVLDIHKDEEDGLRKERNRIAKLFRFPEK